MVAPWDFLPDQVDWADVGWKAMAANISDIAAMGGRPTWALVTGGLPQDFPVENARALYQGLLECAAADGGRIVGGDVARSEQIFITVALLGVALVAAGTIGLIGLTDHVPFDRALFEVTSAFATVGLSTGITPTLPPSAQVVLVILMYVGRVGTIAVGTAIALNTRSRLYRYPEERPLVG
jgi:hypothetical protein